MYKTINEWLDSTIKNEYYHRTLESIRSDTAFHKDWKNACKLLCDRISSTWTREQYLAWKRDWKLTYKKLTSESRWSKTYRSVNRNTEFGYTWNQAEALSSINVHHEHTLRDCANNLLEALASARENAEIAYLASHPEKILVDA